MSIARDRADRKGTTPIQIGSTKLTTDGSDNLSVTNASGTPKKLIASEIEIGDSSNKVIIKKGSDNKVAFQTQASGGSATDSNAGGGVTVYANVAALQAASGTAEGDLGFVTDTKKLMIRTSTGWYFVATVTNATPVINSAGNASYSFATDGTAVVIDVSATEPEGETITYAYQVTAGSLTNGGGATATVVQGTGANVNRFTITPSTNSSYAGSFTLKFSATDPNSNIALSSASVFTLAFFTQLHVPSGTTMLLGLSFDNNGLGKVGSWNTPTTIGSGITNYYSSGGYNAAMNGHAGYANPNFNASMGFRISEIVNGNALKGKTWIIWYKGGSSQIISGQSNSIGVPILCDQGNAWAHSGIDQGKIAFNSGNWSGNQGQRGTTNVCDDNWHMLTWIFSDGTHTRLSNNSIGMWVDGTFETSFVPYAYGNHNAYMKLDELFMTYSSNWEQPERVDAFQIFDNELTDAQISEIYGS